MKKRTIISLVLLMVITLCACSSRGTSEAETASETVLPLQETANTTPPTTEPLPVGPAVQFTALTAIDNEYCKVELLSIDPTHPDGFQIQARLENKSTDAPCRFWLDYAEIHGIQCEFLVDSMSSNEVEVEAGGIRECSITLLTDVLRFAGIELCTNLNLGFHTLSVPEGNLLASENVQIFPYGQELAEESATTPEAKGSVVFENDAIQVSVIGYSMLERARTSFSVLLSITNKTDAELQFFCNSDTLNGNPHMSFKNLALLPQKTALFAAGWGTYDVEGWGIQEVSDVTEAVFTMTVMNMNDGSLILNEESVVVNP